MTKYEKLKKLVNEEMSITELDKKICKIFKIKSFIFDNVDFLYTIIRDKLIIYDLNDSIFTIRFEIVKVIDFMLTVKMTSFEFILK